MEKTHDYLLALGRVLMSGLFVWGGYGKLMAPGATTQHFAQVGVPLLNHPLIFHESFQRGRIACPAITRLFSPGGTSHTACRCSDVASP